MKLLRVKKQDSNGEIHFIIAEPIEGFDDAEIREITRKDAAKPLLLLRAE